MKEWQARSINKAGGGGVAHCSARRAVDGQRGTYPLEARDVRILNVELLTLYSSRGRLGGRNLNA